MSFNHMDFIIIILILAFGGLSILLLLLCKNRIGLIFIKIYNCIFCTNNKIIIENELNSNIVNLPPQTFNEINV